MVNLHIRVYDLAVQGVYKVLLQFKKFITKAVDEISYIDLFYIY